MRSYSTRHPDIDSSPTVLFGKNIPGFIGLYAQPATPSTDDFPLPFGPMIMGFVSLYFFIVYRLPPHRLRPTTAAINRLLSGGLLQHPRTAIHSLDDIAAAHEQVEAGADAKVLISL